MKNNEQARMRRLENAANYLLGVLGAMAILLPEEREREDAREMANRVAVYLAGPAAPANEAANEREQAGNCVDGMSV